MESDIRVVAHTPSQIVLTLAERQQHDEFAIAA
jgi:hypothetical protein